MHFHSWTLFGSKPKIYYLKNSKHLEPPESLSIHSNKDKDSSNDDDEGKFMRNFAFKKELNASSLPYKFQFHFEIILDIVFQPILSKL